MRGWIWSKCYTHTSAFNETMNMCQWISTCLMLLPNAAISSSCCGDILLLLYNSNFATVMNCPVSIWSVAYLMYEPPKGWEPLIYKYQAGFLGENSGQSSEWALSCGCPASCEGLAPLRGWSMGSVRKGLSTLSQNGCVLISSAAGVQAQHPLETSLRTEHQFYHLVQTPTGR